MLGRFRICKQIQSRISGRGRERQSAEEERTWRKERQPLLAEWERKDLQEKEGLPKQSLCSYNVYCSVGYTIIPSYTVRKEFPFRCDSVISGPHAQKSEAQITLAPSPPFPPPPSSSMNIRS